jgi:hypothetical protein
MKNEGKSSEDIPLAAVFHGPQVKACAVRLALGDGHGRVVDQRAARQRASGDISVAAVVSLREGGGHKGREGKEGKHLVEWEWDVSWSWSEDNCQRCFSWRMVRREGGMTTSRDKQSIYACQTPSSPESRLRVAVLRWLDNKNA